MEQTIYYTPELFLMSVLLLLVVCLQIRPTAAWKLSKCAPQIYFIYFRCYFYVTFQKVCTFCPGSGVSFWPMGQNISLYPHISEKEALIQAHESISTVWMPADC